MTDDDETGNSSEASEEDDYERFDYGPFTVERIGRMIRFSSNLDEETHADFKKKVLENLPEQKKLVDDKIEELLALLSQVNGVEVVGVTSLIMAMMLVIRDETHITAAKLEYLMSAVTALPQVGSRSPNSEDISRCLGLVDEIQTRTRWYYTYESMKPSYDKLESNLRFHLLNWTLSVRGDAYLVHVRQEIERLHSCHDDLFRKNLGFTAIELFDYLESLREVVGEKVFEFIASQQSLVTQAMAGEEAAVSQLEQLASVFRFADVLEIFEVTPASNTEEDILKAISCTIGDNKEFLDIPGHRASMLNPTLIKERPFVSHNDKFYAFGLQSALYSVPYLLQSLIADVGDPAAGRFQKAKEQYVENESVEILATALKANGSQVQHNLHFPGGELDGLILLDDAVVLVEAKAGKLRESAHRGSYRAFLDDMKSDLLGHAFEQTEKALAFINSEQRTVFTDKDGNGVFTLAANPNYKFYSISVYYEPIGHILNGMNLLRELELVNHTNHLAVNIDDLKSVADLTVYPTFLLHYIERRFVVNELGFMNACDEMDLYMFHLRESLYIQRPEKFEVSKLNVGTYTEEADEYFEAMYVGEKLECPTKNIPPLVEKVIEKLETQRPRHFVTAGTFIFDMSTEALRGLDLGIRKCEELYHGDKEPHTLALLFNDAGTVFLIAIAPDTKDLQEFFPSWTNKHFSNPEINKAIAVVWSPCIEDENSKVEVFVFNE